MTATALPDGLTAPEQRGELSIAPKAVEKIATTAAGEIDDVGGASRRLLGLPLGSDDEADAPRVDAQVDGRSVTLHVTCSVAYPAPVAAVTTRLRDHLATRVHELTDLDVRQVDITVAALTSTARPQPQQRSLT